MRFLDILAVFRRDLGQLALIFGRESDLRLKAFRFLKSFFRLSFFSFSFLSAAVIDLLLGLLAKKAS